MHGSGVHPGVLKRAGIKHADLLLAVTAIDEVNLIASMTARKHAKPGLRAVTRIRQSHDVAGEEALRAADVGLDAATGRRPLPLGSPPRPHLRGLPPHLRRLRRRHQHLAFITAAEPVEAILTHLGLPTTAPPLSPARGPPRPDLAFDTDAFDADAGFDLDQTPAYDPTEPEPVADFDFDQSTGA